MAAENSLQKKIVETAIEVKSGVRAVHIATDDYSQLDEFVRDLAAELGLKRVEWDFGYGLSEWDKESGTYMLINDKMELSAALKDQMYEEEHAKKKLFVIKNARLVLEGEQNGKNLAQLQQTILRLKKFNKGLILYTDEKRLMPDALSSIVYYLDLPALSKDELQEIVEKFVAKKTILLDSEKKITLASTCVGMSKDSFMQILEKAAQKKEAFNDEVLGIAHKTKKQFVEKSGLLKFVETKEDIKAVGGLERLKSWLDHERTAFFLSPEDAKKQGIQSAKGIMLAGMPGCGKSLSAKTIAKLYSMPLLSLDIGSLMGKYLGESEENLRRALKLAENASPCVLWVDEIEKAFAGLSGDESGVTQRLFGYLLTWLNDKTARIFVVATANDVAVLPPEFLRRGRFDEIFYVDFPNVRERESIFKLKLNEALKAKIDDGKITEDEIKDMAKHMAEDKKTDKEIEKMEKELTAGNKTDEEKKAIEKDIKFAKNNPATDGYAGSDIEALVQLAVKRAWTKNPDASFTLDDLSKQRKNITPLKEVLKEKIEKNKEKFGQYKLVSASKTADDIDYYEQESDSKDPEKLLKLVQDDDCPLEILEKIVENNAGNKEVCLEVLRNSRCPAGAVDKLCNHEDPEIRDKAMMNPTGGKNILKNGTLEQKRNLALNIASAPKEFREYWMKALAEIKDTEIDDALLNCKFLSKPTWEVFITRAKSDKDLKQRIRANQQCEKCDYYIRSTSRCSNNLDEKNPAYSSDCGFSPRLLS
ncbi:MAG: hypothetical protein Ta2A_00120 [Treponemataceae bacterium]|nr:MAG: hypothetical protein Ta2A_00120 [Treponemataceae bacterium]